MTGLVPLREVVAVPNAEDAFASLMTRTAFRALPR